ncbi:helix-turn-helix domain-containing protein [Actinosynnema sp. NPDC047251]|uniref:HTH tetR-type domain-containing protein n=1 Tax=Saccharothrix espanaensis (strain ATCC 51144 / DSM 44229 / JCM 9112 / NBRC 15066 / NRRL 15764) TaxID=1179773 RepID=K0JVM9_SACES|nr:helix-turn-helix domain-containing protein [Saccharothrix espanaensis]CCH28854.1 hypothetical protein BN6_15300 [Saccharothrix espanaensis DSM 44229]
MKEAPPSRAAFLEAGRQILLTSGWRILLGGLTVRSVCERAGISATTFAKIWPNRARQGLLSGHERFVNDLLGTLAGHGARATEDLLGREVLRVFTPNQRDPRRALRPLAEWDAKVVREDLGLRVRTLIATFARDHTGAVKSVRDEYDDLTGKSAAAYSVTLASWGGELRKPFTPKNIAVVLTALVEGMALRWLLDPKAVPEGLFGDAVVALIGSVVDVDQRHQHIDDVMEPITREVMRSYRMGVDGKVPNDPREAIIAAAKEEFAQRSYYQTHLNHIATHAGVPHGALKALFATKSEILDAGLNLIYESLQSRARDDQLVNRPPEERVPRHLERLATAATENRVWFDALMMRSIHELTHSPLEPTTKPLDFPALLTPSIESGQSTGTFTNTLPAHDLATLLTNNVLLHALNRRAHNTPETASSVCTVLLDGISARR